jgi:hypothetical protein
VFASFESYSLVLNEFVNTHPARTIHQRRAFDACVAGIDALLACMVRNFDTMCNFVNMRLVSPWSACMGLFSVMARLVVIVEDTWTVYRPNDAGPRWRCSASALTWGYIATEALCVTDGRVKSYPLSDLLRTLDLLALQWYRITPHPDVRAFMYALLHRACIVVAHPGHARVFDVPKYVAQIPQPQGQPPLFVLNDDGVRAVSTPIIRMLCIVDIGCRCPDMPLPLADALLERSVAAVRRYMRTQIRLVMKMNTFKAEIAANFARYMIVHGDVEKWTFKRGIEAARAPSLLMTVRAYTQPAYAMLRQFAMVDKMVELMDEREPTYFQRWTRAEHAYSHLCKLSVAGTPVAAHGILLLQDYVIPELEIPGALPKFSRVHHPTIIQTMGRMHVFWEKKIIRCACIEQAIAIWALLILNQMGGILAQKYVAPGLRTLLVEEDAVRGLGAGMAGMIVDD